MTIFHSKMTNLGHFRIEITIENRFLVKMIILTRCFFHENFDLEITKIKLVVLYVFCVRRFLSLLIMMIWGLFQTLYVFSSNRIYFSHGKIIQPWLTTMLFIYANKKTQNSFLGVGIGLGVSFSAVRYFTQSDSSQKLQKKKTELT